MENQYFAASAVFLFQSLFGLYILAVMLRLLLQRVRADFYNPISQFLVKDTNPPQRPLRRVIPGWGGIALASELLLTEPLLAPARRLIPAISGSDRSPIAVLLLLQLTKMLILTPLADLGRHLGCAEWRRRGSSGTAMTSSCACACSCAW